MRINRHQIRWLSEEILKALEGCGLVHFNVEPGQTLAAIEKAITYEMMAEDRVEEEVRKVLEGHKKEIESGMVDYNAMFDMVKKKLIRDRDIVI